MWWLLLYVWAIFIFHKYSSINLFMELSAIVSPSCTEPIIRCRRIHWYRWTYKETFRSSQASRFSCSLWEFCRTRPIDFRSFLQTSKLNIPVFLLPGIHDLQIECGVDGGLTNVTSLQYYNAFSWYQYSLGQW